MEKKEKEDDSRLTRDLHIRYFKKSLQILPHHYLAQDANRLTLAYFALAGLDILNGLQDNIDVKNCIDWIYNLQILPSHTHHPINCGFRGGTFYGQPFGVKSDNILFQYFFFFFISGF